MKKKLLKIFATILICLISYQSMTLSSGPPESYSNAPGEGNCANPGCHGGTAIVSGSLWNGISLDVVGGPTLGTLIQDSTYDFELTFSNPAAVKFGFQLCVLQSGATALTQSLGSLIAPSSETQIVSSPIREYLEHTGTGNAAPFHTKTWTFQWRTPVSYNGGAVFYVVINSTNDDNSSSGDTIYAKTFSATISLPVKWLVSKANRMNQDVKVSWAVASETNNDRFVVERSMDAKNWFSIGELPGRGTSNQSARYEYTDYGVKTSCYYRIKQVDFDGKSSYSTVLFVQPPMDDLAANGIVYNFSNHTLKSDQGQIDHVSVYSQNGLLIMDKIFGSNIAQLPDLASGVYFLKLTIQSKTVFKKIVIS